MTVPDKQVIAARLRKARTLAGLSQGQVAKMLDVHRPTISQIEAGERNVTAEEIARFAEMYDVSTAWLLGERSETLDEQDDDVQLAARELKKLKPDDLKNVLAALAALRKKGGAK